MSRVVTRQGASAFNQPLTFDTSSVTDMSQMFYVRPPLTRAVPSAQSVPPCTRCVHRHRPHTPSPSRLPPPVSPSSCASSVPRQQASAFNQPLSFDTSGVTDVQATSQVRPPRACRAQCPVSSSVHAACTATACTRPRAPCVALLMCLGVTWQGVPYTYSGMQGLFDVRMPLAHAVPHDQYMFLRAHCVQL